ncbi:cytochrome P450 [Actinomadura harenae]|nr:cytochrome P450 [Actinomadura harenae]
MTTSPASVAHLDLFESGFSFTSPQVKAAQQANWYADSPIGPIALRYNDVSALLHDPRFRLGGQGYMDLHNIDNGVLHDWWMSTLMSLEGAPHQRLRRLMGKAFTPARVEDVRAFTAATAARLADRLASRGDHDFVAEYAERLPTLVLCRIMGIPPEDYDRFHSWARDLGAVFAAGGLTPEVVGSVETAIAELGSYVNSLVAHRREAPGPDLLTAMINAHDDGGALSSAELHDMVLLLVWAGQDTTARQLSRALIAFAEHPEQWDLLRDDPALVPSAVDEVLRWTPQSRLITRYAAHDLTYRGLDLPAGRMVFCSITAANRDPAEFPDPDVFDVRRGPAARHINFGGGAHHCLGRSLAQMELAEALTVLTARLGAPTVCGPITWRDDLAMIHGPDSLPLRWTERTTGT